MTGNHMTHDDMTQDGMTDDDVRAAAKTSLDAWVADNPEVSPRPAGEDGWFVMLEGERKRTIGVFLTLGDRTLIIESHFMRAPDENAGELYELLLKRHQRSYALRFCVYDTGDIMLVGVVPLRAVSVAEVDRLAGAVLIVADETYNAALRLGFEGYIEREQRWREGSGMPRNPIT